MTLVGLAACLTLLAYLLCVGLGTPVALALLPGATGPATPEKRSRRLFAIRLLPAGLGIFVALGVVLPAFLWHEPMGSGERVGTGLALAAVLSAIVVAAGSIRGFLGLVATRRLVRGWARGARPVDLSGIALPAYRVDDRFPVVAVAGWLRPRLYVSSNVLEQCTSDELRAIVAHEAGHVRRGDTWKRALLRACPDFLALTSVGVEIERRWSEAAEQAADDLAADSGGDRSLDLASALVRVARLAGSARPRDLPLTTLYRGGGVAERVARLIEPSRSLSPGGRLRGLASAPWFVAASALTGPIAAAFLGGWHPVHRVLEAVVRLLG